MTSTQEHIDYAALNALKEVMEDDFELLINTFIQDSSDRINTLRMLIPSTDGNAIRRAAHSFKGSCSNLGVLKLANLCSVLEQKGLAENFSAIADDIDQIEKEFAVVKIQLLDYV